MTSTDTEPRELPQRNERGDEDDHHAGLVLQAAGVRNRRAAA